MVKVDGGWINLLQGVSQQPPRDRVEGTCSAQNNMTSDSRRSLNCRNPILYDYHIPKVNDTQFHHVVQESQVYTLLTSAGALRIFNNTQELSNVSVNDVTEYLSSNMATKYFDDAVYMINKDVITYMNEATTQPEINGTLVFCKGGVADFIYKISILQNNVAIVTASYTPTNNAGASGSAIIADLANALDNAVTTSFPGQYTVEYKDDVMSITKLTDGAIEVSVDDEKGGEDLVLVNKTIDDTADLPRYAPDGYTVTVTNSEDTSIDDYYYCFTPSYEYTAPVDGFGVEGEWNECAKPGSIIDFDLATMPVVTSIDSTANTFSFAYGEWKSRVVGDDDTNPIPAFVGNKINNISVFQGRLVFLSKAVVMSRTKEPLSFWKDSATVLRDDDVIDLTSDLGNSSTFKSAIQHNKSLIINTATDQYILPGSVSLTPSNAALNLNSSYSCDDTADPITTGTSLLLPYVYGSSAGITEMFPSVDNDNTTGNSITNSIPKYISGAITKLSASSNFRKVFILADKKLYLYEYLWSENTKIQSSFSKIDTFDFDIEDVFVHEDKAHIVYSDDANTYFGHIPLDVPLDEELGVCIYLDNRVTAPVVDGVITLPYNYSPELLIVGSGNINTDKGLPIRVKSYNDNVVYVDSYYTGNVYVGNAIDTIYEPTDPIIKDKDDVPISTGRLRIQKLLLNVYDTSDIYFGFKPKDGSADWTNYLLPAATLSDSAGTYGKLTLQTRTLSLPLGLDMSKYRVRIIRKGYTPITLLDLEWVGSYSKTGKRM